MNSAPTVAMDMPPCDVLAFGMAERRYLFQTAANLPMLTIASENLLDCVESNAVPAPLPATFRAAA